MRAQVEQAGSQGSSRRLRRKGAHRRGDILSPAEGQGLSLVSGSESLLSLSPSLLPTSKLLLGWGLFLEWEIALGAILTHSSVS